METMIELTIGVVTFLRDHKLFRCISHLLENVEVPFYLHVADQGNMTEKKQKFYRKVRMKMGRRCKISKLPFNFGFGPSQKFLFGKCKTPYFIQLCDDEFPRKGSLSLMLKLIKELTSLKVGIVAPVLWEGKRYRYLTKKFWIENNILCVENICNFRTEFGGIKFEKSPNGIPYLMTNFTAECGIVDARILEKVNWDDRFKLCKSHIDFFLQLSQTEWKAVTTPDAIFDHYPEELGVYRKYRRSVKTIEEDGKKLEQKWEIKLR